MVEKEAVPVPQNLNHKLLSFLGKVAFFICHNITSNTDINYLVQYGVKEGNHDIKMMIKFLDELDERKFIYVCVYYEK